MLPTVFSASLAHPRHPPPARLCVSASEWALVSGWRWQGSSCFRSLRRTCRRSRPCRCFRAYCPAQKVMMPVIAAGTGGYKGSNATDAVRRAFTMGFNHVHTAFDYFNLKEIGVALKEVPRAQYFLSGMTSPCSHPAAPPQRNVTDPKACRNLTMHEARSVMNDPASTRSTCLCCMDHPRDSVT